MPWNFAIASKASFALIVSWSLSHSEIHFSMCWVYKCFRRVPVDVVLPYPRTVWVSFLWSYNLKKINFIKNVKTNSITYKQNVHCLLPPWTSKKVKVSAAIWAFLLPAGLALLSGCCCLGGVEGASEASWVLVPSLSDEIEETSRLKSSWSEGKCGSEGIFYLNKNLINY